MRFLELAKTFEIIEATRKRGEISANLAVAFKRADPEEAKIIAYLIQSRLGPPYAAPDLGINEWRLAETIAQVVGKKTEKVWSLYKDVGDFGIVAEKLLPEQGPKLTVQQVYDMLLEIAQTAGSGSAEKKLEHLVRLFSRLGKIEARYLARIAQGKLRLAVGDVTLVDALSRSLGKPKLRTDIERAYAFSSDLGLVAYVSMTEGEKGLEKIRPTPGRPVLPALAQRVTSPAAALTRLGRVLVEPKYDGLRLQLHKDGNRIWLFTRSRALYVMPKKGLLLKTPKTKTSIRNIPIPDVAYDALIEHRHNTMGTTFVFTTENGTPFSPRNILKYFQRELKRLNLPIIPFHNLRHSCASFHLAAGTSPKFVQELLGHSTVAFTLHKYSHLLPGVADEAIRKLNNTFQDIEKDAIDN